MSKPMLADMEEEINKQLQMIHDIAYDKSNPYMASSLSPAEVFWLRRMYLYIRYIKERQLMPDSMLEKYLASITDFLWLRVNENREGRNELISFMGGIREKISQALGGVHKYLLGGSNEK